MVRPACHTLRSMFVRQLQMGRAEELHSCKRVEFSQCSSVAECEDTSSQELVEEYEAIRDDAGQ